MSARQKCAEIEEHEHTPCKIKASAKRAED